MKNLFLLLALLASLHLYAIVDTKEIIANEVARLDQLIEATQQTMKGLQQLRQQVIAYQERQRRYLESPDDNELLYQLIKSAYVTLESIKAQHMETAFEPEFLSEISLLAKPAQKSAFPKPS